MHLLLAAAVTVLLISRGEAASPLEGTVHDEYAVVGDKAVMLSPGTSVSAVGTQLQASEDPFPGVKYVIVPSAQAQGHFVYTRVGWHQESNHIWQSFFGCLRSCGEILCDPAGGVSLSKKWNKDAFPIDDRTETFGGDVAVAWKSETSTARSEAFFVTTPGPKSATFVFYKKNPSCRLLEVVALESPLYTNVDGKLVKTKRKTSDVSHHDSQSAASSPVAATVVDTYVVAGEKAVMSPETSVSAVRRQLHASVDPFPGENFVVVFSASVKKYLVYTRMENKMWKDAYDIDDHTQTFGGDVAAAKQSDASTASERFFVTSPDGTFVFLKKKPSSSSSTRFRFRAKSSPRASLSPK